MKSYKLFFLSIIVFLLVLMPSSCTRTNVDDPAFTGHAGFEIILSGTADPSTMFITQDSGWQYSTLRLNASYNTGAPVSGKTVMFKISDEFGEFTNDKRTISKTTNANGNAQATYRVHHKHRDEIGAEQTIFIYAVLEDDNRTDVGQSIIFDNIPIYLVTDYKAEDTFTYRILEPNPDEDGTNDNTITIADTTITSDITFQVYLYNRTGTSTISYNTTVDNPDGILSSPSTGSGSTNSFITFTIDSTGSPAAGDYAEVQFTVTSPFELFNNTITIRIDIN